MNIKNLFLNLVKLNIRNTFRRKEMINLKDGSKIEDPRFDRLIEFDEKSREFPIRTILEAKKPRSYTWRCTTNLDQGPDGACVGFGEGHGLLARPAEVKGIVDDRYAKRVLYWEAQKVDMWEGGSYPGARPFYEGTSVLAGMKVGKTLGWYDSYRWAFGIQDLILGVGYNGPAIIGTYWTEDMFDTDSKGYIHASGKVAGGHCTLVRAVSIKKKRLTIRNSWGKVWGNDGDCYISFDDMDKLLKMDGEAAFCLHRHRKPKIK